MAALAADLIRKQDEAGLELLRNMRVYQKALDRFAHEAPVEIVKPIIDELVFDWTVRDLVN